MVRDLAVKTETNAKRRTQQRIAFCLPQSINEQGSISDRKRTPNKKLFQPGLILFFLNTGGPNWRIAFKYTVPVVLMSILFNLPKFYEWKIEEMLENETNSTEINIELIPTDLRLNDYYVYYYVNIARLVVSGLVPLVSLAVLNLAIYR